MNGRSTFLVLGATGLTGTHFVARALGDGHRVRALVRTPAKLASRPANLDVRQGSITDDLDTDALVSGCDAVVAMLGDRAAQRERAIVTAFVRKLVPSMRRHDVTRFFYQAGAMSRPYGGRLTPALWVLRHTVGRSFDGQHRDNEAVMAYLATEANDIDWIVHRAAIGGDGPSKGVLTRSPSGLSVATHRDCAAYAYRTLGDAAAVRTADFSRYG